MDGEHIHDNVKGQIDLMHQLFAFGKIQFALLKDQSIENLHKSAVTFIA